MNRRLCQAAIIVCVFLIPVLAFAEKLIPMGDAVRIELQLGTVYVTRDVIIGDVSIKKGALVKDARGENMTSISELERLRQAELIVQQGADQQRIKLSKEQLKAFIPLLKDQTDGNGTLTYIDPETSSYGAIGHQIVDATLDFAQPFKKGDIFLTSITQIKKSVPGNPGFRISSASNNTTLGTIEQNGLYGIFGSVTHPLQHSLQQPLKIIRGEQIKIGPAVLFTTISGNKVTQFDIHIDEVNGEAIQFTVTDKALIEQTGGIIQGMSGSPIVQNNYFIGAVTHMYVENPLRGAAITILEMKKKTSE